MIRRKEGWHPGREKSTEPRWRRPRLAGTGGEGRPSGVLASQVLGFALPRAGCTQKVPRRRKAPDFSNSDVQRATLAIHSLGLVCVFFPVFCNLFFLFFSSVFVPSAPTETPPLPLVPEAVGKGAPSPSPSVAPRQQRSPARTCPEVSGARRDAGFAPRRQSRSRWRQGAGRGHTVPGWPACSRAPVAVRKVSSSCKIGIFRSLE